MNHVVLFFGFYSQTSVEWLFVSLRKLKPLNMVRQRQWAKTNPVHQAALENEKDDIHFWTFKCI